ncbi:MAG TPA: glycine oxidase ThiO [Stellaceae bacterium]|jgi:glycine oxidase|nr:glycine oxidase ThiO [Stellaceae bacterium]
MNLVGDTRRRESVITTPTAASTHRPSTVVIGAGVIGLSLAWRLAQAGCRVRVYDRGEAGHGASWAAAGMLAATVETEPGEETLLTLTLASQRLWPEFARELEAASGVDIGYRTEGTIVVALNRDDSETLRHSYEFQKGLGLDLEWISAMEARRREPHLKPGVAAAVFCGNDHQVDNRCLVLALAAACRRAGVEIHQNRPVRELILKGGRAAGIVTDEGEDRADVVVLAAGAWSRQIAGIPAAHLPPVRPIKGQMMALRMDPAAPLIRHVVWAPHSYMVPRNDGRLIIGGTVEERGFDTELTAGGLLALLDGAWRAVPAIEELPIAETWVGFRPGSRDDAPMLGPSGIDGLAVATGHHRNGILLTPVSAQVMSEFVLAGRLSALARPFSPERFAAAAGLEAAAQ